MALTQPGISPFTTNLALRGGMGLGQLALLGLLFHSRIRRDWHLLRRTNPRLLGLALAAAALPHPGLHPDVPLPSATWTPAPPR